MKTFPFNLTLPVVAAPMFLVSGPNLVIEACRAGIVGSFPSPNCRTTTILDEWLGTITDAIADIRAREPEKIVGPWALNLVTHSSNARLADDLKLVAEYKPPIVITALGSPAPAMEVVKSYGGLVIADVVNLRLARKAAVVGVDGLACVSAGAGGHTGHLSPFAFVSAVREFYDGSLIVGGGIADGAGIVGAIAAGADLVYMGTRFVSSQESLAVDTYKQMIIDHDVDDLIVSPAITGTPASWLRPSLIACGLNPDALPDPVTSKNYTSGDAAHKRWKDVWAAGQGLHAIKAVEPVADIVRTLSAQHRSAMERFCGRGEAE